MNARTRARAATLRRSPDELFASEAKRRGFRPASGKVLVRVEDVDNLISELRATILSASKDAICPYVMSTLGKALHTLIGLKSINLIMPDEFDRDPGTFARYAPAAASQELWKGVSK